MSSRRAFVALLGGAAVWPLAARAQQVVGILEKSEHRQAHISRLRADMPASFINDPEHWRRRAEEARSIAEQMSDSPSKDAMLRIAKDYERLAERAEERAKGSVQPR
jgi:hypothetical protein